MPSAARPRKPAELADGGPDAVDRIEGGAGQRQDRLAGGGEPDSPARPVEQLLAKLAFQAADLGADTRLADQQLLGGPGEVPLSGDGGQVLELTQFHNQSL